MKGKRFTELLKEKTMKIGAIVLASAIVLGGTIYVQKSGEIVPELVTYVDSEGTMIIPEDETPLGQPKVTKSTKTKKSTKKIKMKKASTKTYSKNGKPTTKITRKTTKSKNTTTTTETAVNTTVTDKYVKGSKIDTRVTTTKTTVTKTTVAAGPKVNADGTIALSAIASKVDKRVSGAYSKLGFYIKVDPSVSYSGLFDARTRSITLKEADDTIYHELGHFVGFMANNVDRGPQFLAVYNAEKSKYTEFNKIYVLSTPSEYFAESFKNYTLNPAKLQSERPQTYAAIQSALAMVNDTQVNLMLQIFGPIWSKQ